MPRCCVTRVCVVFQLENVDKREKSIFENINIDWNLSHDDGSTDFSDDDTVIDERVSGTRTCSYGYLVFRCQ